MGEEPVSRRILRQREAEVTEASTVEVEVQSVNGEAGGRMVDRIKRAGERQR